MYFRLGGGTVKGISKPGVVVWSRIFVDGGLKADLGIADSVELPVEETQRRWNITTPQWPIMHAVLQAVSRDQMIARHKANHIQVAYAPDEASAVKALAAKAEAFDELGIDVSVASRRGTIMRVGLIGTGAISHKHAQAYANIGFKIAAACDAAPGRA